MYHNDVPADRAYTPKASTLGVSAGTNYRGHLREVSNDRYYFIYTIY